VPRTRPLIALLILACLGAAGCGGGGGGGGGSADASGILKQTFSGSKNVKSANLNIGFTLNAQGSKSLSGPVSMKLTGPFESQGKGTVPQFDLSISVSGAGKSFSAGAVSTGTKGFLKYQGKAYEAPADVFAKFKQGFEQAQKNGSSSGSGTSLDKLGIKPLDWLKDPKNVGTANVGGTDTDHISAAVDVPKLLDGVNQLVSKADQLGAKGQLPSQFTPAQRKQVEDSIKSATIDVYSGKGDKILRKLDIKLSFEVPAAQQAQAGGLKSGDLGITVELDGVNTPQTITAPTGARPLSELLGSLGGLGAALGAGGSSSGSLGSGSSGSSGSGSSGAPGASGATPATLQKYSACLQKAAGNLTKAQECAKLLQP
jgi:hypothetical protein